MGVRRIVVQELTLYYCVVLGVCVNEYMYCCCCTPEKKRKTPRSIDERVNVCAALLPSMLPPWQGTCQCCGGLPCWFRSTTQYVVVENWGDIAVRKPCAAQTHTNQMIFRCLPVQQIMFSVSFFKIESPFHQYCILFNNY